MGKLEGKVALVTGGGTGIGRATALAFSREGIDVAVNYSRSKAEAEATAAEIEGLGRKAMAVCADVSDDAAVRNMVDQVATELGQLDILVNNAGWTKYVPMEDLEGLNDDAWDRCFDVNVKGTFHCSRAAVPKMKANGAGQIVNIASIAGLIGRGSSMAYAASKAAVISLTKSLAIVLAPEIRVNAILPGVVDTRWMVGMELFMEANVQATPLKKGAQPEDVAEVVMGVVRSDMMTGQNLVVDGGRTL